MLLTFEDPPQNIKVCVALLAHIFPPLFLPQYLLFHLLFSISLLCTTLCLVVRAVVKHSFQKTPSWETFVFSQTRLLRVKSG